MKISLLVSVFNSQLATQVLKPTNKMNPKMAFKNQVGTKLQAGAFILPGEKWTTHPKIHHVSLDSL